MSANEGDRTPQLGDSALVADLLYPYDPPWPVVQLGGAHGDVVQVRNPRTGVLRGVVQDQQGNYRLRTTAERVWFAPAPPEQARPASVTDLCDALANEFGCDPSEADLLAAGLASEADTAARVLLEPGTPCPPARLRNQVAAVLLTAAAKRLAGGAS